MNVPRVPNSTEELGEILQTYDVVNIPNRLYRGTAHSEADGGRAVIFISNEMMAALSEATHLSMDGTFVVRAFYPSKDPSEFYNCIQK